MIHNQSCGHVSNESGKSVGNDICQLMDTSPAGVITLIINKNSGQSIKEGKNKAVLKYGKKNQRHLSKEKEQNKPEHLKTESQYQDFAVTEFSDE